MSTNTSMANTNTTTKEFCFINGKILPVNSAKISITDIGLLRGYAVFDSVGAIGNTIIFFDEHYKRFSNSAAELGLKIPYSKAVIIKNIETLLKKNKYKVSKIRLVLTGGEMVGSLGFDQKHPNFFILVQEVKPLPRSSYEKGEAVVTYEHQRELPVVKSHDYLVAVYAQPLQKKAGAIETVYTKNGKVLECTISNFFIIKGNRLITAKDNILRGITRGKTLQLALKNKMIVEERDVKVSELQTADEAFITSTHKGIVPIVKINGRKVGKGKVGNYTRQLMSAYEKLEQEQITK